MKINLAKSAGFCFGVRRALTIAEQIATSRNNIEMLGDIVHNEQVVSKIEKSGIKKITRLGQGKGKILLIRAHGAGIDVFKKAKNAHYEIIDATCPMVKEIQKIAQGMEKQGYKIIIIGDKLHDEVRGILGQLKKKALVIDRTGKIPFLKKAAIVVQSTQDLEIVNQIISTLRPHIRKMKFFNTICQPTRAKQEEIRSLALKNDVMLVIGSRTSANTKRLFEISRSLNPRTYWIESKKEIHPQWFRKAVSVGLSAGASTPDSTTKGIIGYLKRL